MHSVNLASAVTMWPTPDTMCWRDGTRTRKEANGRHAMSLHHAVAMWPTPKASDAIMGMTARTSGRPLEKSTHLQAQVYVREQLWTTPCAADSQGTTGGGNHRSLRTDVGGQLNPEWVELLMGFPAGWTDV